MGNNNKRAGIECVLCLKIYYETDHFPMINACGHVFCVSCCKQNLKCPLCKAQISQPDATKAYSVIQNVKKQQEIETNRQKMLKDRIVNDQNKFEFTCLNDGNHVVWKVNKAQKCGICLRSWSDNWYCSTCKFIFCMECAKNEKDIMRLACINDNHQIFWNKSKMICGVCNKSCEGNWECSYCRLVFCTRCGRSESCLRTLCLNDRSQVNWKQCQRAHCGVCLRESTLNWNCSQCKFVFCMKCGRKQKMIRILCLNDQSEVVWKNGTTKCSICRQIFPGHWQCYKCRLIFCTDCGRDKSMQ